MGWMPIRERGKPVECQADWPLFYMNDFSQLGLMVGALGAAVTVLEANGLPVLADERGSGLFIDDPQQLAGICALLSAAGIECELTDLVSCVYQG